MNINDVVKCLNEHILSIREKNNISSNTHIVLQIKITPHKIYKIYKNYEGILWHIKDKKSYKIFEIKDILKVSKDLEEKALENFNFLVCKSILDWMSTESYNQVIKGEYKDGNIEYKSK